MGMETEATMSRFYTLPTMSVAEIGALMVDLGDVMCRCSDPELRKSIIDFLNEVGVTAEEKGEAGDYTYPVVFAEVKVRDGVKVREALVCVAPACLCEAIKQLSEEDPKLMSHVRVPVAPLEGIYDLTKPIDGLKLRAIVTGVCRGEGNREVIKAFAKYYVVKRANEDPKFREKLVGWLRDPTANMPYGLAEELLEYLHELGIYVRERAVRDALYSIRLSGELASALGIEVKAGSTPTITNCAGYAYVQSLIRKLGVTDMSVAQRYAEVLCLLTDRELRALLGIVEGECGGRLKSMLERGASAEDIRSLITECTEPEVKEVEVPVEEGKPVEAAKPEVRLEAKPEVRPEVGATAKPEAKAGEGEFELKPRTLIDIKVNCVGPNADETDECRFVKAATDFALGRGPPDKFLQLFDAIAPTKFVEPTGEDFVAVKGTITKLLRAYGITLALNATVAGITYSLSCS